MNERRISFKIFQEVGSMLERERERERERGNVVLVMVSHILRGRDKSRAHFGIVLLPLPRFS